MCLASCCVGAYHVLLALVHLSLLLCQYPLSVLAGLLHLQPAGSASGALQSQVDPAGMHPC